MDFRFIFKPKSSENPALKYNYTIEDYDKPLSFANYLFTICNHMTKFRGLSKFSMNCGSDEFRFGICGPA